MSEIKVQVVNYGEGRNYVLRYVDPISGKQKTKTAGTRDEQEAIKAAGVWEDELNSGRFQAPAKTTWEHFRQRFAEEKLAEMPPSSQRAYRVSLDHLERVINPDRLAKLTTAVLSDFKAKLAKSMKATTLGKTLRHVKGALRWAERQGMMVKAPLFDMPKLPKGEAAMKGRPVTGEEFDRMIAVVPDVRSKDAADWTRLLDGLWLSGLRLGESLALTWDEGPSAIDQDGKHPAFRIMPEGQKSHRAEVAPMTPDFAAWLWTTFPEADRYGRVFKLTHKRTGGHVTVEQASNVISAIGERAGVVVNKAEGKFASAHDLRRAFGTRWAARVMPAKLQKLMRHGNINTTMTYYVATNAAEVAADLWAKWPAEGNTLGNTPSKSTRRGADASDATPSRKRVS